MGWDKTEIKLDSDELALAQAPIIISASRATDIPAFYSDWFLNRLKKGYSAWINPFNGVKSFVSYSKTRLIVFWSKNPHPLLQGNGVLDYLKEKKINSYIQFTLNDYTNENLEPGIPSVQERISTFKRLVDYLGVGKVIWRFDPLILTDKITIDDLCEKIFRIGNSLKGYTNKLVFSFADITTYRRVQLNLLKSGIKYRDFSYEDMILFAKRISEINSSLNLKLSTCCESINLENYGITHNSCIDTDLIIKYFFNDQVLMNFLGIELRPNLFGEVEIIKRKKIKDTGQRKYCGCIESKDIGQYNTCPHLCKYCYANNDNQSVIQNYEYHIKNPLDDMIIRK